MLSRTRRGDLIGKGQGEFVTMLAQGIKIAEREHVLAREAYDAMRLAPDFATASRHWGEFLYRWNRVFNKLKRGAVGPAKAWYKTREDEMRADPLLSYLHEARNADEHGIEDITEEQFSAYLVPPENSSARIASIAVMADGSLHVDAIDHEGRPLQPSDVIALNRFRLVPVSKGRGQTWAVPTKHLGMDIDPVNVAILCRYALSYAAQTIGAGRGFL